MLKYLLYFFSVLFLFFHSCNNDVFETIKSSGNLTFSRDTIFLDTVFSNTSSSTRTLKIFNKSSNNITIPNIQLGRGDNSFYRLNVDGIDGKSFENIDILANDSIFVFIEATIDFNQVTNPIYTDSIVFDKGDNFQDVKLVTLVQDAHFLFPKRNAQGIKEKIVLGTNPDGEEIAVDGFYLDGNTVWTNDKPYVIYGYVGVNSNNSLTIEKGVRVHFHRNSGLLVEKDASLQVNGALNEEVVFEGDRLEPSFSEIPGQWGAIWLRAGSRNHIIDYAIIKNNTIGILMDSIGSLSEPTLKISNTQIYNTSSFGLLGRTANIDGKNLVIGNNGQSSLACTIGGTYNFTHATFANFWNNSIRNFPTVLINNFVQFTNSDGSESILARDLIAANFTNCIIEGSQNIEFFLDKDAAAVFNYNFKNNLLKFDDLNGDFSDDPLYDFDDISFYQNNILNGVPDFKDVEHNKYIIGQKSDAINNADINAAIQVPTDILGINRTINPDIGAYQNIVFEEE
jgi:hypothetical protein